MGDFFFRKENFSKGGFFLEKRIIFNRGLFFRKENFFGGDSSPKFFGLELANPF